MSDAVRVALALSAATVITLLDTLTPLGYGEWVLYILPVLLFSNPGDERYLLRAMATVPLFLLIGLLFSPPGVPFFVAVVNRLSVYGVFWTIALIIIGRNRALSREHSLSKFPSENPNPVLRISREGIVLYANEAGRRLRTFWSGTIGSAISQPWCGLAVEVLASGSQKTVEIENDGRTFTLSFVPIVEAGYVNIYARDITEQRRAHDALLASENRLKQLNENLEELVVQRTGQVRDLSKALLLAEQRERKRFSYILHENLQQLLLGAKMLLGQHLRDHQCEPGEQYDNVAESLSLLQRAVRTTRILSIELNPPILRTQGLDAALQWLADHMHRNYGLSVDLRISGAVDSIKDEMQLMLTQMVRELLNNVIQHSGVLEASLLAACEHREIRIVVSDAGHGFDPAEALEESTEAPRLGLFSIRERLRLFGGELDIKSIKGQGTRNEIVLPIDFYR